MCGIYDYPVEISPLAKRKPDDPEYVERVGRATCRYPDQSTALISDWREETEVVKCKYWHESDVIPVETAAGLTKTMAPRDEITTDTYRIPRPKSDVHDYYRNFVAAIDGKTTQLVTHEQMLRDLEIVEAAFRSVEEGNVVRVSI